MHRAPYQERLDLHRYSLTADIWSQARVALEQIQELENDTSEKGRMTSFLLRVSFYTLYAKPFKQRAPLKIGIEIVPKELVPVHNGLITLRDKMFAHTDGDLNSSDGTSINTVLVHIKPRSIAFGINTLRPLGNSIKTYLGLLSEITKTVIYRRNKIWLRWGKHLRLPMDSRWFVNLSPDSDEVLTVASKEPRIFSHSIENSISPIQEP